MWIWGSRVQVPSATLQQIARKPRESQGFGLLLCARRSPATPLTVVCFGLFWPPSAHRMRTSNHPRFRSLRPASIWPADHRANSRGPGASDHSARLVAQHGANRSDRRSRRPDAASILSLQLDSRVTKTKCPNSTGGSYWPGPAVCRLQCFKGSVVCTKPRNEPANDRYLEGKLSDNPFGQGIHSDRGSIAGRVGAQRSRRTKLRIALFGPNAGTLGATARSSAMNCATLREAIIARHRSSRRKRIFAAQRRQTEREAA